MRICPNCETSENIKSKNVEINVGHEKFRTKTEICLKCGNYALTPKVRMEMDKWGRSLKKNVIEPQPLFSATIHQFLDEAALKYGIKKVPLIKVLISFYLSRVISRDDYELLHNELMRHESFDLMQKGKKSKISVPIHYLTFRKLEVFCEASEISQARGIEEAVVFCIGLLTYKNVKRLKEIAERLEEFVEDYALAA